MKKYLAFAILIFMVIFSNFQISNNVGLDPYLPNGIMLEVGGIIANYNDSFLIRNSQNLKLLDLETGKDVDWHAFNGYLTFLGHPICLYESKGYIIKELESGKALFGDQMLLDNKGSYLYSKVISERFKDDPTKHEYLNKIVICPYNAKCWILEKFSHNNSVSYNEFIIINDKLFSLFQRDKLDVYNALNGSLIMTVDDFEDWPRFFEQNKDFLFLGKHLLHLNSLKVIAKIDQKGEWARVRLEDDRLIVCTIIDNQYNIAIYDLEGKLISIKTLDVFHKNKDNYTFFKMSSGIGKNCVVFHSEKDTTFEIWSFENKLLDVIRINWSVADRFAGIDMVIGDKLIIPLRTAIICYDTATLKIAWTRPMASRVKVIDNRWVSYFERTSIDSGTSAILMDIFDQSKKISIPTKSVNNLWVDYKNDILMFDSKFEKNSKWPVKVTQNGKEYPYKVQYSGETIYPFTLGNSLFCVYCDSKSASRKFRLLSLNGNS